jgi:hypothetical protein
MGLVPGFEALLKFGRNSDVSAAADEDIWEGGGDYVWPTTAERLSLVSTSDQDAAGGTGCATVEVFGLDVNYDEISEVVALDGTTPVLTTLEYLRAPRGICRSPGSTSTTDENAGIITATQETSAIELFRITAGQGQTLLAVFTVPGTKTMLVNRFYATVGRQAASALSAELITRPNGECFQIKRSANANTQGSTSAEENLDPPLAIPSKADVKVRAGVSGNNIVVNGGFDAVLYENSRFLVGD